jgi:hypothetical protein
VLALAILPDQQRAGHDVDVAGSARPGPRLCLADTNQLAPHLRLEVAEGLLLDLVGDTGLDIITVVVGRRGKYLSYSAHSSFIGILGSPATRAATSDSGFRTA